MDLDRVFSREILGQVLFGGSVTVWLEKTVPILIALALAQPITLAMLIAWTAWALVSISTAILLLYWSYLESSTDSLVNYVNPTEPDK